MFRPAVIVATLAGVVVAGFAFAPHAPASRALAQGASISSGIHKIKHIVIIMQENRSFDHYFGTYPGADGIPMRNGEPIPCNPDVADNSCVRPYHGTRIAAPAKVSTNMSTLVQIRGGCSAAGIADMCAWGSL